MSKLTTTGKSRPDLIVYTPSKTASEANPLFNDPSFESLSEIEDASNHEKMMSFLQNSPHHRGMNSMQSGMHSGGSSPNFGFVQVRNNLTVPNESNNVRKLVMKSEGNSFHYHAESIEDALQPRNFSVQTDHIENLLGTAQSKRITSNNGEGSKSGFSKTSFANQKVTPETIPNLEGELDNDIDVDIDIIEPDKNEGKDKTPTKKQGQLLEKLKLAMTTGEKVGWEIFMNKSARAKARIGEAFLNAKDHALFDATPKELQVINDKTYVQKTNKLGRRSYKRKHEAPSLRKILEKHGIISKKNLERKALKRVLNKIVRRKSKKNYMKEIMNSLKKEVQVHWLFLIWLKDNIYVHPKGKFRLVWDIVSLIFIFYDLFYIPYQIGFSLEETGFLYYFDVVKDFFFFTDFIINCFTAFYDKSGALITSKRAIFKSYVRRKWFIPDLLTALPIPLILDFILNSSESIGILRFVRFIRFVRLIRVLKAVRLIKIFNKVEELFYSNVISSIKSFLSLFFYIILFAHWMACLFRFVGSWVSDDGRLSWLSEYNLQFESSADQYVAALYWSLATMITVGYGDIVPYSTEERIVSIVAMLSGCAMFAYSMNAIGVLVQNWNARASKTRQLSYTMSKYMEEKNVSKQLRNKVTQYMEYMAESQKESKESEEKIYSALSETLQNELKKDINGQVLRDNVLFQSTFGTTFRNALSYYLEEQSFSPGEIIFDEADRNHSYYFLVTGTVEVFISASSRVLSKLERGSHFGEYSFFTGKERTAAVRSSNFTNIFHIKKEIFFSTIEEYPFEKETFHMIKDKINLYNSYGSLKMKCHICGQDGHYAKYCFRVHYTPDADRIINEYKNAELNFMTTYRRPTKKSMNALTGKMEVNMRTHDLLVNNPHKFKRFLQQNDPFRSTSSMVSGFEVESSSGQNRGKIARRKSRNHTGVQFKGQISPKITGLTEDNSFDMSQTQTIRAQSRVGLLSHSPTTQSKQRIKDKGSMETSSDIDDMSVRLKAKARKSRPSIGKIYFQTPTGEKASIVFDVVGASQIGTSQDKLDKSGSVIQKDLYAQTQYDVDETVFDMVTHYQVYFPHNNLKRVLEDMNGVKKQRRLTGVVNPPKKKLGEMFNRSNTDRVLKFRKSARSKSNRVKSLFVNSRYSIWNMARKSKKAPASNINQLGMIAMKNQALAGLIPNIMSVAPPANAPTALRKRRVSRSLGSLDRPIIQTDDEENEKSEKSEKSESERDIVVETTKADIIERNPKKSNTEKGFRRGLSYAPASSFQPKNKSPNFI